MNYLGHESQLGQLGVAVGAELDYLEPSHLHPVRPVVGATGWVGAYPSRMLARCSEPTRMGAVANAVLRLKPMSKSKMVNHDTRANWPTYPDEALKPRLTLDYQLNPSRVRTRRDQCTPHLGRPNPTPLDVRGRKEPEKLDSVVGLP